MFSNDGHGHAQKAVTTLSRVFASYTIFIDFRHSSSIVTIRKDPSEGVIDNDEGDQKKKKNSMESVKKVMKKDKGEKDMMIRKS